jgi:spore coat-associated protein N
VPRLALSRGSTAIAAATAAGFLAVAGAAAAVVVSAGPDRAAGPRAVALADGSLALSDSLGGGAILTAAGVAPGDTVEGTLTVRNTGSLPGELGLSSARVQASGAHGRDLLDALELRIVDVTGGASVPVHDGTLADVDVEDLAVLAPGAGRTLRFVARLPAGGDARDNRLQGASVQLAYAWTLTATDAPEDPGDPTPTTPTVPTTPTTTTTTPTTPTGPEPPVDPPTVPEPPAVVLPVVPQPLPAGGARTDPDDASPAVRSATRTASLDGHGRFAGRVSCAQGATSCRVRVRVRRGRTTVARRTVTVRPGRSVVLRARPNAAMMRSLRRGRPVVVHVALQAVGTGRTTSTTRVVVRPARRR